MLRIYGELRPLSGMARLTAEEVGAFVIPILVQEQKELLLNSVRVAFCDEALREKLRQRVCAHFATSAG